MVNTATLRTAYSTDAPSLQTSLGGQTSGVFTVCTVQLVARLSNMRRCWTTEDARQPFGVRSSKTNLIYPRQTATVLPRLAGTIPYRTHISKSL